MFNMYSLFLSIVIAEYSYDSWGRMRDPATWVDNTPGTEPQLMVSGRSYTGHEHLDEFSLINMNGRIYDPILGRFLSVDPVIQYPDNTQSYNGYAYCLNSPLSASDPSGYQIKWHRYDLEPDNTDYNTYDASASWAAGSLRGKGPGGGYFPEVSHRIPVYQEGVLIGYLDPSDAQEGGTLDMLNNSFEGFNGVTFDGILDPSGQGANYYPNGLKINEAVDHARYGNGTDVYMPLAAIDSSKVKVSDFKDGYLVVDLGGKYKTNWNDQLVHGTIKLELLRNNIVQIAPDSDTRFDFEVGARNDHPWFGPEGHFWRNVATLLLESYVDDNSMFGYKPYNINYIGTATISY